MEENFVFWQRRVTSPVSGKSGEARPCSDQIPARFAPTCSVSAGRTKPGGAQDVQLKAGHVQAAFLQGWAGLGCRCEEQIERARLQLRSLLPRRRVPGSGNCSLFPFTPSISFSPGGFFY